MELSSITIPIYNWRVIVLTNLDKDCNKEVSDILGNYFIPSSVINELVSNLGVNCGNHLCNTQDKISFMVFGKILSMQEYLNIVSHECLHLVDRMAEHMGLEIEAKGYLMGFIMSAFYQYGIFQDMSQSFTDAILNTSELKVNPEEVNKLITSDL